MARQKHTYQGTTYNYSGSSMSVPAYHLQDGWFFDRLTDGSVRISKQDTWLGMKEYQVEAREVLVIPAGLWQSVMCSVANAEYTGARWNEAGAFHNDPK